MTSVFTVRDLVLRFGERSVLKGIDLEIPAGRVTAIIGPNGCGKSTLLRSLSRLGPAGDGQVLLEGTPIADIPHRVFARQVALLPQAPMAPEQLTVIDLVTRGRDPHRRWYDQWSRADEDIVLDALDRTGLRERADQPLSTLSGGQRQRAWIALALAQSTPVLLLDEPTTYLDIAHQLEVLDTVRRLHLEGVTVVMVLHDLSLAARYADHIVAMRDGRIAATGTVETVITPDMIRSVFDIECTILADPRTGRPVVLPHSPT
ncbi:MULTISPECIES: ABC transporter ATP-binding protein [Microbacterium]|uniref:ABC transporter ATP-binding protein n=1 Tax=Microbacterium TaxID=33882 RepID=UPI0027819482|nr:MULTISPECIES: ABC transporter ATP-binding protein [Microbacterium]MDQ1085442.1 iron complex transport system ATP-binding protein [Microbacterium sp. SORGH_AS_0344]MDQ1169252.1 iron complex transport system ATP-binding protein [Microbacterium proteolyticum]